jgi:hypothetical protein
MARALRPSRAETLVLRRPFVTAEERRRPEQKGSEEHERNDQRQPALRGREAHGAPVSGNGKITSQSHRVIHTTSPTIKPQQWDARALSPRPQPATRVPADETLSRASRSHGIVRSI